MLVVEDEPALAAAVSEALTDAGFRVDRAADGQYALERIQEKVYDLVVCDLKMPRMDGRGFYRAIVDDAPALARRIVFVTGDVAGTETERFPSKRLDAGGSRNPSAWATSSGSPAKCLGTRPQPACAYG